MSITELDLLFGLNTNQWLSKFDRLPSRIYLCVHTPARLNQCFLFTLSFQTKGVIKSAPKFNLKIVPQTERPFWMIPHFELHDKIKVMFQCKGVHVNLVQNGIMLNNNDPSILKDPLGHLNIIQNPFLNKCFLLNRLFQ